MAAQFSTQGLANFAWAFAASDLQNPVFFETFAEEVLQRGLAEFSMQGLSNITWSLAVTGRSSKDPLSDREQELLMAVSEQMPRKASQFSAQGLANIVWAFATATCAQEEPCLQAPAAEVARSCPEFSLQPASNTAWAFAVTGQATPAVFGKLSACLQTIFKSLPERGPETGSSGRRHLAGAASEAIAAVWAFNSAGLLDEELAAAAREALRRTGRELDAGSGQNPSVAGIPLLGGGTATQLVTRATAGNGTHEQPTVLLNLPDRLVLRKPPGWEVQRDARDSGHPALGTSGEGQIRQVADFLRTILLPRQFPLVADVLHNCGMIHRLDVPNSGLLLVAKTYEAYYDLALQLNSGTVVRDYVVLCHGWLDPERQAICAPLHWRHGGSAAPSEVSAGRGKPSRTFLKVLAHLNQNLSGEAFSLVAIRIETGRRHQIRSHTAHIGHPTACDGKYTSAATFLSDREWCQRNFLHRYRLAFRDSAGRPREVSDPLPEDLVAALTQLSSRDGRSELARLKWLGEPGDDKESVEWAELEGLSSSLKTWKAERKAAAQNKTCAENNCGYGVVVISVV
ncbi:unnamed protein product, partial [Polarella glacialis]